MGLFKRTKSEQPGDAKTSHLGVDEKKSGAAGAKTAQDEKDTVVSDGKTVSSIAGSILLRPMLSEKTTSQEAIGQYTFVVSMKANKAEVKKAIKALYGITPKKVRMINVEGKETRSGRYTGRRSDWKKAIVLLPKGQTISIHEGV